MAKYRIDVSITNLETDKAIEGSHLLNDSREIEAVMLTMTHSLRQCVGKGEI